MHIQKLLLITFLVVANAKGQTQDTPSLEPTVYELPDLIVTGTLWDTPIKDVAESVTVFSEGALQDRQANYLQDLVMEYQISPLQEAIIALVIFNFVGWAKIPNLKERLPT